MVEAEGHLKQLPISILDMYKVFERLDMLSTCIQYQPYTGIPTLLLGSDFGEKVPEPDASQLLWLHWWHKDKIRS